MLFSARLLLKVSKFFPTVSSKKKYILWTGSEQITYAAAQEERGLLPLLQGHYMPLTEERATVVYIQVLIWLRFTALLMLHRMKHMSVCAQLPNFPFFSQDRLL